MANITIDNLCKKFGETDVLQNFNIKTEDGEFVVLVGPSGCGKSTTMRIVAGLESVTSGRVYLGDRDITNSEPKDRDIAMVFQNYALYPHMTIFKNIAFSLRMRKIAKSEIAPRVQEVADILGIRGLLDRKPKALSGGQRQRVALGRAIIREPQLFLMDEPLSNLDASLRVAMRGEISKLHARLGVTTVYVTHDQIEAMTMGSRIVVMRDGLIQQIGTPDDIYKAPTNRFVARFIGSPPMNFVLVSIDHDKKTVSASGLSARPSDEHFSLLQKNGTEQVWLGIRPEMLFVLNDSQENPAEPCLQLSGRVDLVENLGSRLMIQFVVAEEVFSTELDADTHINVGDMIKLGAKQSSLQFFSLETEDSLHY